MPINLENNALPIDDYEQKNLGSANISRCLGVLFAKQPPAKVPLTLSMHHDGSSVGINLVLDQKKSLLVEGEIKDSDSNSYLIQSNKNHSREITDFFQRQWPLAVKSVYQLVDHKLTSVADEVTNNTIKSEIDPQVAARLQRKFGPKLVESLEPNITNAFGNLFERKPPAEGPLIIRKGDKYKLVTNLKIDHENKVSVVAKAIDLSTGRQVDLSDFANKEDLKKQEEPEMQQAIKEAKKIVQNIYKLGGQDAHDPIGIPDFEGALLFAINSKTVENLRKTCTREWSSLVTLQNLKEVLQRHQQSGNIIESEPFRISLHTSKTDFSTLTASSEDSTVLFYLTEVLGQPSFSDNGRLVWDMDKSLLVSNLEKLESLTKGSKQQTTSSPTKQPNANNLNYLTLGQKKSSPTQQPNINLNTNRKNESTYYQVDLSNTRSANALSTESNNKSVKKEKILNDLYSVLVDAAQSEEIDIRGLEISYGKGNRFIATCPDHTSLADWLSSTNILDTITSREDGVIKWSFDEKRAKEILDNLRAGPRLKSSSHRIIDSPLPASQLGLLNQQQSQVQEEENDRISKELKVFRSLYDPLNTIIEQKSTVKAPPFILSYDHSTNKITIQAQKLRQSKRELLSKQDLLGAPTRTDNEFISWTIDMALAPEVALNLSGRINNLQLRLNEINSRWGVGDGFPRTSHKSSTVMFDDTRNRYKSPSPVSTPLSPHHTKSSDTSSSLRGDKQKKLEVEIQHALGTFFRNKPSWQKVVKNEKDGYELEIDLVRQDGKVKIWAEVKDTTTGTTYNLEEASGTLDENLPSALIGFKREIKNFVKTIYSLGGKPKPTISPQYDDGEVHYEINPQVLGTLKQKYSTSFDAIGILEDLGNAIEEVRHGGYQIKLPFCVVSQDSNSQVSIVLTEEGQYLESFLTKALGTPNMAANNTGWMLDKERVKSIINKEKKLVQINNDDELTLGRRAEQSAFSGGRSGSIKSTKESEQNDAENTLQQLGDKYGYTSSATPATQTQQRSTAHEQEDLKAQIMDGLTNIFMGGASQSRAVELQDGNYRFFLNLVMTDKDPPELRLEGQVIVMDDNQKGSNRYNFHQVTPSNLGQHPKEIQQFYHTLKEGGKIIANNVGTELISSVNGESKLGANNLNYSVKGRALENLRNNHAKMVKAAANHQSTVTTYRSPPPPSPPPRRLRDNTSRQQLDDTSHQSKRIVEDEVVLLQNLRNVIKNAQQYKDGQVLKGPFTAKYNQANNNIIITMSLDDPEHDSSISLLSKALGAATVDVATRNIFWSKKEQEIGGVINNLNHMITERDDRQQQTSRQEISSGQKSNLNNARNNSQLWPEPKDEFETGIDDALTEIFKQKLVQKPPIAVAMVRWEGEYKVARDLVLREDGKISVVTKIETADGRQYLLSSNDVIKFNTKIQNILDTSEEVVETITYNFNEKNRGSINSFYIDRGRACIDIDQQTVKSLERRYRQKLEAMADQQRQTTAAAGYSGEREQISEDEVDRALDKFVVSGTYKRAPIKTLRAGPYVLDIGFEMDNKGHPVVMSTITKPGDKNFDLTSIFAIPDKDKPPEIQHFLNINREVARFIYRTSNMLINSVTDKEKPLTLSYLNKNQIQHNIDPDAIRILRNKYIRRAVTRNTNALQNLQYAISEAQRHKADVRRDPFLVKYNGSDKNFTIVIPQKDYNLLKSSLDDVLGKPVGDMQKSDNLVWVKKEEEIEYVISNLDNEIKAVVGVKAEKARNEQIESRGEFRKDRLSAQQNSTEERLSNTTSLAAGDRQASSSQETDRALENYFRSKQGYSIVTERLIEGYRIKITLQLDETTGAIKVGEQIFDFGGKVCNFDRNPAPKHVLTESSRIVEEILDNMGKLAKYSPDPRIIRTLTFSANGDQRFSAVDNRIEFELRRKYKDKLQQNANQQQTIRDQTQSISTKNTMNSNQENSKRESDLQNIKDGMPRKLIEFFDPNVKQPILVSKTTKDNYTIEVSLQEVDKKMQILATLKGLDGKILPSPTVSSDLDYEATLLANNVRQAAYDLTNTNPPKLIKPQYTSESLTLSVDPDVQAKLYKKFGPEAVKANDSQQPSAHKRMDLDPNSKVDVTQTQIAEEEHKLEIIKNEMPRKVTDYFDSQRETIITTEEIEPYKLVISLGKNSKGKMELWATVTGLYGGGMSHNYDINSNSLPQNVRELLDGRAQYVMQVIYRLGNRELSEIPEPQYEPLSSTRFYPISESVQTQLSSMFGKGAKYSSVVADQVRSNEGLRDRISDITPNDMKIDRRTPPPAPSIRTTTDGGSETRAVSPIRRTGEESSPNQEQTTNKPQLSEVEVFQELWLALNHRAPETKNKLSLRSLDAVYLPQERRTVISDKDIDGPNVRNIFGKTLGDPTVVRLDDLNVWQVFNTNTQYLIPKVEEKIIHLGGEIPKTSVNTTTSNIHRPNQAKKDYFESHISEDEIRGAFNELLNKERVAENEATQLIKKIIIADYQLEVIFVMDPSGRSVAIKGLVGKIRPQLPLKILSNLSNVALEIKTDFSRIVENVVKTIHEATGLSVSTDNTYPPSITNGTFVYEIDENVTAAFRNRDINQLKLKALASLKGVINDHKSGLYGETMTQFFRTKVTSNSLDIAISNAEKNSIVPEVMADLGLTQVREASSTQRWLIDKDKINEIEAKIDAEIIKINADKSRASEERRQATGSRPMVPSLTNTYRGFSGDIRDDRGNNQRQGRTTTSTMKRLRFEGDDILEEIEKGYYTPTDQDDRETPVPNFTQMGNQVDDNSIYNFDRNSQKQKARRIIDQQNISQRTTSRLTRTNEDVGEEDDIRFNNQAELLEQRKQYIKKKKQQQKLENLPERIDDILEKVFDGSQKRGVIAIERGFGSSGGGGAVIKFLREDTELFVQVTATDASKNKVDFPLDKTKLDPRLVGAINTTIDNFLDTLHLLGGGKEDGHKSYRKVENNGDVYYEIPSQIVKELEASYKKVIPQNRQITDRVPSRSTTRTSDHQPQIHQNARTRQGTGTLTPISRQEVDRRASINTTSNHPLTQLTESSMQTRVDKSNEVLPRQTITDKDRRELGKYNLETDQLSQRDMARSSPEPRFEPLPLRENDIQRIRSQVEGNEALTKRSNLEKIIKNDLFITQKGEYLEISTAKMLEEGFDIDRDKRLLARQQQDINQAISYYRSRGASLPRWLQIAETDFKSNESALRECKIIEEVQKQIGGLNFNSQNLQEMNQVSSAAQKTINYLKENGKGSAVTPKLIRLLEYNKNKVDEKIKEKDPEVVKKQRAAATAHTEILKSPFYLLFKNLLDYDSEEKNSQKDMLKGIDVNGTKVAFVIGGDRKYQLQITSTQPNGVKLEDFKSFIGNLAIKSGNDGINFIYFKSYVHEDEVSGVVTISIPREQTNMLICCYDQHMLQNDPVSEKGIEEQLVKIYNGERLVSLAGKLIEDEDDGSQRYNVGSFKTYSTRAAVLEFLDKQGIKYTEERDGTISFEGEELGKYDTLMKQKIKEHNLKSTGFIKHVTYSHKAHNEGNPFRIPSPVKNMDTRKRLSDTTSIIKSSNYTTTNDQPRVSPPPGFNGSDTQRQTDQTFFAARPLSPAIILPNHPPQATNAREFFDSYHPEKRQNLYGGRSISQLSVEDLIRAAANKKMYNYLRQSIDELFKGLINTTEVAEVYQLTKEEVMGVLEYVTEGNIKLPERQFSRNQKRLFNNISDTVNSRFTELMNKDYPPGSLAASVYAKNRVPNNIHMLSRDEQESFKQFLRNTPQLSFVTADGARVVGNNLPQLATHQRPVNFMEQHNQKVNSIIDEVVKSRYSQNDVQTHRRAPVSRELIHLDSHQTNDGMVTGESFLSRKNDNIIRSNAQHNTNNPLSLSPPPVANNRHSLLDNDSLSRQRLIPGPQTMNDAELTAVNRAKQLQEELEKKSYDQRSSFQTNFRNDNKLGSQHQLIIPSFEFNPWQHSVENAASSRDFYYSGSSTTKVPTLFSTSPTHQHSSRPGSSTGRGDNNNDTGPFTPYNDSSNTNPMYKSEFRLGNLNPDVTRRGNPTTPHSRKVTRILTKPPHNQNDVSEEEIVFDNEEELDKEVRDITSRKDVNDNNEDQFNPLSNSPTSKTKIELPSSLLPPPLLQNNNNINDRQINSPARRDNQNQTNENQSRSDRNSPVSPNNQQNHNINKWLDDAAKALKDADNQRAAALLTKNQLPGQTTKLINRQSPTKDSTGQGDNTLSNKGHTSPPQNNRSPKVSSSTITRNSKLQSPLPSESEDSEYEEEDVNRRPPSSKLTNNGQRSFTNNASNDRAGENTTNSRYRFSDHKSSPSPSWEQKNKDDNNDLSSGEESFLRTKF